MSMTWPKLSETLTGPRSPGWCQACADPGETRWLEGDGFDRMTTVVVVLCQACAEELIEPHPRLYKQLGTHDPYPATHNFCVNCVHRDKLTCKAAQMHGGPGVHIVGPKPVKVHVQRAGPGGLGRRCSWETIYREPMVGCEQFEVKKEEVP